MSIGQYSKVIQNVAVRSKIDEMEQFLAALDVMGTVHFPDQAGKAYFHRFIRWTVRELLSQGAHVVEQSSRMPASLLQTMGVCVGPLSASDGKAGNELRLSSPAPLPQGHAFAKGDWVFVTFPADGVVLERPETKWENGTASLTHEGEITTVVDTGMVVKFSGVAKDKLEKFRGMSCRVDRAANRVTFHRQVDALRAFGGDDAKSDMGWIRQVIIASDEPGLLGSTGFEPRICAGSGQQANRLFPQSSISNSPLWGLANPSQRAALKEGLLRNMTLMQGPPGSGKTHTAILLIRLLVASQRGPVLATADSNVAVDNLVHGCAMSGLEVVRVGRPESTRPDLEQYNLLERAGKAGQMSLGGNPNDLWAEEKRLLSRAQVVCCTCSGADHPVLQDRDFYSVIIDEAAQATEPSVLVPLVRLNSRAGTVVQIGDHMQLPPTVVDRQSDSEGLAVPLFERMVNRGVGPLMLDIQYRMHPAIAQFPSRQYYKGQLRTGIRGGKRPAPAGVNWPDMRAAVAFLPVDGREVKEGTSFANYAEVGAIETMLESILAAGDIKIEDVGIITPYAAQVRQIRRSLSNSPRLARYNCRTVRPGDFGLEVSSVDGFQGREKELIIVSTVRANTTGSVGFLADIRRLNVTITRARRGLLVCGHFDTLAQDPRGWRPWLSWAQERGLLAGHGPTNPDAAMALLRLNELSEEQLLSGHI
eukprot:TRINITY_DN39627_c0_g1_i1.p1 TRINITY_DN39627_c0_g1~~TRINITY_DN39627_c0_g1_i1.p1  ORF type:complete len:786 (+),score=133.71 TRINITY_DN39627_c0_g1_i1:251-2359(+)